jgi:hypothetical protein
MSRTEPACCGRFGTSGPAQARGLLLTATSKPWATLVIRSNKNGSGVFLFSKEGVTQGDPLSMFTSGIGILPLIRRLKLEFPKVEQQSWYADDAGAGSKFDAIWCLFLRIQEIGHSYGCFPEPSKSVLIMPLHNLETARSAFANLKFKVVMGSCYFGG